MTALHPCEVVYAVGCLLAGVVAAVNGCAVSRLSADEVLDGSQMAEARSAAISRVER